MNPWTPISAAMAVMATFGGLLLGGWFGGRPPEPDMQLAAACITVLSFAMASNWIMGAMFAMTAEPPDREQGKDS